MCHIDQQEAGLADLTISGTCLSVTLYREHPITRERSVITSDMVYTFYPTGNGTPRPQHMPIPTPILTTMYEALTTPKAPRNLIAEDPRAIYPIDFELPPVFKANVDPDTFEVPMHQYPPPNYTSLPAAFQICSNPLESKLTFIAPDDPTHAFEMFYNGRHFRVNQPEEPSLCMAVVLPLEAPGVNPYRFFPGDTLEARPREDLPGDNMVRIWVDVPEGGEKLTQINSEGTLQSPYVFTSTSRYLAIANKENVRPLPRTSPPRTPLAPLAIGQSKTEVAQDREPPSNVTPVQQ
jgi:hypothetical protein